MTAAELIAELAEFPPDMVVVHSTGRTEDREEVTHVRDAEPGQTAWNERSKFLDDGTWIEIA